MNVGVIGLGAMGIGVSRNLVAKGFSVYGVDVRRQAVEALVAAGGFACTTPAELGAVCNVLIVFVVDADQTFAVLFGEQGAVEGLAPGSVVIACATVYPAFMTALAERLGASGVALIEAPVSGGIKGAADGRLTLMTSGPDAAYHTCHDVLQAISTKVYKFGTAHGTASKIKIINQLLVGVQVAAAAEAVALGLREGVDPEVLYDVITNSAGNSWAFADRVPRILKGDYTPPHTALDIFVKDLRLVLDLAQETRFSLPLASAAYQIFASASSAGLGGEDDSSVIKTYQDIALPQPRSPTLVE